VGGEGGRRGSSIDDDIVDGPAGTSDEFRFAPTGPTVQPTYDTGSRTGLRVLEERGRIETMFDGYRGVERPGKQATGIVMGLRHEDHYSRDGSGLDPHVEHSDTETSRQTVNHDIGGVCRACRGRTGDIVLDLGEQPASDYFPSAEAPGPDPTYPLQMWLCSTCKLAQLVTDPTAPDEPKAAEPAALRVQAAAAVDHVAAAKWLQPSLRVAEYGSPHGGSWLELLRARGLTPAGPDEPADVVLDCFGLMHCADQAAAMAERTARVAPGGVLLLQYHSLSTIVDQGQWNALRHGHFAYYSATALSGLLAGNGFALRSGWEFELYGGTVLLAATRVADAGSHEQADRSVRTILQAEEILGITDPDVLARLQQITVRGAE
jgi:hypothetical protein